MRFGSTWRKPAPVPLCPPKIPHDLTWARTWAATLGSQQLIAWAMACPIHKFTWTSPDRKMQTPVSSSLNRLGDLGFGLVGTGHTASQCGYITVMCLSVYRHGFNWWIVIEHSQIITTNNYNSLTGLYTPKITTTHKIKFLMSVFTRRFLAC
jgi:hypothetical protein